jgi:ATP-dependent exoDNAse (exonuclease V) beta subunit
MSALADTEARRRILTEFGTSFFVEAAAGTGKTTALVGRIVGLIRSDSQAPIGQAIPSRATAQCHGGPLQAPRFSRTLAP